MNFSYTVTKEEYLETLILTLKAKRKTLVNILIFVLMTVVQFSFAVWCAVKYGRDNSLIYVLLVLSLGICVVQLVYQLCLGLRARTRMNRDIRRGNISPEFWSRQHVTLKEQVFRLKCGKNELKYDCAYFSRAQKLGGMLLLSFRKGKTVHQLMLPLTALEQVGGAEAFVNALSEAKRESLEPGAEAQRPARPEDAACSVTFSYDADEFNRAQVKAARYAYANRIGWTFTNIARLVAAAFLIYHFAIGSYDSIAFRVFVVCIIVLLLYPPVVTFTPLCRLLVRRNTAKLFGERTTMEFSLDVADGKLFYAGDSFRNEIPLDQVYSVAAGAEFTVIYLKNNTVITIPYGTSNSRDTYRLVRLLEDIADDNWKNRSTREKLR